LASCCLPQIGSHGAGDIELWGHAQALPMLTGHRPPPTRDQVAADWYPREWDTHITNALHRTELHPATSGGEVADLEDDPLPRPHLGVVRRQHQVSPGPREKVGARTGCSGTAVEPVLSL